MAYTPFKFPQQPTLQQTLSRTPGYFGPLMPPQPKWWQIMQQKSPYSFKGMPVVKPPMPGNPNFVGPLQPPAVPQPSDPNFVGPTQNQGMLPSATPSPNAIPKNQKAAIIMGALSDIFRGQDPTQNTVVRQQQMVAMEERAKKERALAKTMRGETLTESDKIDLFGTKLYADIEAERIRAKEKGSSGTSLMQNTGYIDDLYAQRDALPENDPMRQRFDIMIRNAEAQAGAGKYDIATQFGLAEAKRIGGSPGGLDLTPIESGIDTAFAKDAAEYIYNNKAQVQANLKNLGEKINILEAGEKNVSGPEIGLTPEILAPILIPDAVAFEDDVRDVVFQSLREKLGAQFTEREGDRLVAAAFNKSLSEEVNISRLRRLYGTIEDAALAKENAIAHYNEFGTIKGYQSSPLNFESIMNDLVSPSDFEGLTDEQLLKVYESDDTTDEERDVIESIVKARG